MLPKAAWVHRDKNGNILSIQYVNTDLVCRIHLTLSECALKDLQILASCMIGYPETLKIGDTITLEMQ